MCLNVACITNIWRDNIYADTNLCNRRLTRINKTRAEKYCFTVELTEVVMVRGGCGDVKVANFHGTRVTAKCYYQQIFVSQLLNRGINMAAHLPRRHSNLVRFIGASLKGEPIMLTELMTTSCSKGTASCTSTLWKAKAIWNSRKIKERFWNQVAMPFAPSNCIKVQRVICVEKYLKVYKDLPITLTNVFQEKMTNWENCWKKSP